MSKHLDQQLDFIREAEKLKTVERRNRTLDGRYENSAEHSWHVALLGLVLADHSEDELNLLKVLRMLLLHDFVEIDAGDTWAYSTRDDGERLRAEQAAAERLFGLLPSGQAEAFHSVWEEFEAGESAEARYARAIDALQPLINHLMTASAEELEETPTKHQVLERKRSIADVSPRLWLLARQIIEESTARGLYRDDAAQ